MKRTSFRSACLATLLTLLLPGSGLIAAEVKFTAPDSVRLPASAELRTVADYGGYRLHALPESDFRAWQRAGLPDGVQPLPQANRLLFDAQPFDTQNDTIRVPDGWSLRAPRGETLQMVQFVGPVRSEWLDRIKSTGATPVHYVANYGYLVWADESARQALDVMAAERSVLQFSAPMPAFFKLGPAASARLAKARSADDVIPVTVQMIRHGGAAGCLPFSMPRCFCPGAWQAP